MGLEFQIQEDKVCYTPLKDKCDAIRNLESPKTLRQTRAFCGMVNFLLSLLPNLCRLLIPIYDLQKKAKKFKWTEEAERAFNDIKKLLISPPVLKAPTPDGLFHLESDTSREGMGGTLLQKQGDEWVVIGYHSKRLQKSAKNFGVTELELTGLLVNIHGFMQLLCNRYFKVLVDHKAIEYMIKSKTESPTTRLKTLLLKLSEYTIDLKYQKGSEMHTSNALSRLHNFTDTPDQKVQSAFFLIMQTALYWFSPLAMQVATCICCPKGALVLGNVCERLCMSRPLLGSYVHQESM